MLTFKWCTFSELSNNELYQLLKLRSEVFVVEQKCPYLDPDGEDISAMHLLGIEENTVVAYLRLFHPQKDKNLVTFGRIVTAPFTRSKGYGKQLMSQLLEYCHANLPNTSIQCSAQLYLQKFYESYGFKVMNHPHDEDGIPHVLMQKD